MRESARVGGERVQYGRRGSLAQVPNELQKRWKDSRKLPDSADVDRLFAQFAALMEQARTAKGGTGLKSGKRN